MNESDGKRLKTDTEASRSEAGSTENPYRSPGAAEVSSAAFRKRKLGGLDWFFAILMGILAAIFVFPSTCMGALILFEGMGAGGSWILVVSSLLAIVAAIYVGWLVLRARAKP